MLKQHFYFSFTLIAQALCLSFHNPKVWKPYLHYALSAVSQKYCFKALFFSFFCTFPTMSGSELSTGNLPYLIFLFSRKYVLLKQQIVWRRREREKERERASLQAFSFSQMTVIMKRKYWSSQFTDILWDHHLGKPYLPMVFLQKSSLLHPSHVQEGIKEIKRSGVIRAAKIKGHQLLIFMSTATTSSLILHILIGQRAFYSRYLPLKNSREDHVLEMECG